MLSDDTDVELSFQCKPVLGTYGLLFSFIEAKYCFGLLLLLTINHSVSRIIQVSV